MGIAAILLPTVAVPGPESSLIVPAWEEHKVLQYAENESGCQGKSTVCFQSCFHIAGNSGEEEREAPNPPVSA